MVISLNPCAFLFAVLDHMEIQKPGFAKVLVLKIYLLIQSLNYVLATAHKTILLIKLKINVISSVLMDILVMIGNVY